MEARRRGFEAGRRRWANVRIGYLDFARHLDRVCGGRLPLHPESVYLCCACALDRPGARQALTEAHGKDLEDLIARHASAARKREVSGRLFHALFESQPPLVGQYSGSVPLASWLRVTCLRWMMAQWGSGGAGPASSGDRADSEPWMDEAAPLGGLPAVFQPALEQALHLLPLRDQTLMRLHVGHGVSVGALAKAYRLPEMILKQRIIQCRERLLGSSCIAAWAKANRGSSVPGRGPPAGLEDEAARQPSSVQKSPWHGAAGSSSSG